MTDFTVDDSRQPAPRLWGKLGAALMALCGVMLVNPSSAQAETRSLKLYFVHTQEKAEITFKKNGRYDRAGLKKINMFLRDWRRNEPTNMDPRLMDVIWEAYRQSGSRAYIHVVSGYRSPATNSMLRGRTRGVAKKSQHMLGKAMDWYVPDVPLKKLRNIGLKMQAGGVGYYPRSGSPFVHFDVGKVRHWPGISRSELVAVFPQGKTLHVPSDGRPLPGYEQALASYKGRVTSGDLAIASLASGNSKPKRSGGLLAALFGGGADQEEDDGESGTPTQVARAAPPARATARQQAAEEEPDIAIRSPADARPANREPEIQVLSPDQATPAGVRSGQDVPEPPLAEEPSSPETIVAALSARSAPRPMFAQRAAPVEEPVAVAAMTPTERPTTQVAAVAAEQIAPTPTAAVRTPKAKAKLEPVMATNEPQTPAAEGWQAGPEPVQTASVEQADIQPQAYAPAPPAGQLPPGWSTGASGVESKTVESTKTGRVAKGARQKPAATPQVVPAEPTTFATEKEVPTKVASIKTDQPTKPGKKSARIVVRSAPEEVYSGGFQQGGNAQDPSKFSGKAVEFIPVTKFKQ